MPVGVDQPRHHDRALAVDALAAAAQVVADGNDLAVANVDVPPREIAERGVHGEHVRVTNRHLAAPGEPAGFAVAVASVAAVVGPGRGGPFRQPDRSGSGRAAQESPPAQAVGIDFHLNLPFRATPRWLWQAICKANLTVLAIDCKKSECRVGTGEKPPKSE
jgi:hypothetical protein